MNLSATLSTLKLLRSPSLCLPHSKIPTFAQLPIPLSKAFPNYNDNVDIRAVVLDKDNCFARPRDNRVWAEYQDTFASLLQTYPRTHLLIVSNSAGTATSDPSGLDAVELEQNTGLPVLRHRTKKPGVHPDIMTYFRATTSPRSSTSSSTTTTATPSTTSSASTTCATTKPNTSPNHHLPVTHPSQVAIVGDRLFTDVMMANMMGSWAVWVRDGVVLEKGIFVRAERQLAEWLGQRGYVPPVPKEEGS